ncbi:LacI family DNA-binding transcriptional regulator [Actinomadura sp. 6K520]|jgi:DNA-binding LacI/PurR family transcriptional regulator|uniref:LacI family DNA-binding transcriptional regulator n=1 Tax=Actinomadura sp. 6K520 TaxID=2530364 RepID=UPI00104F72AF|nr:LacI family DNA-binding transcriptional regulator [Actinomadura sp. 6K520]TDE22698.1 LacI family transcriptional regulator [Actinomadura sp. 6K520]
MSADSTRASIRAVASLAGVSPSTVSRALNSPELVNAETRRRVLECAERLGYQPNRAAQSLVLGRTRNVGLIVPDIANPFFAPFIKGVEAYFRDTEYAVFLADTDEDTATEVRLAEAMVERVDGLILCAPRMSGTRLRAIAAKTTVVLANRTSRAAPSILQDFQPGMDQAVAHVHALGHRRCAYLSGPANSWSNRQRRRFLGAACAERGIELVDLGPYEPRFSDGFRAADEVLAAGVSAAFAYNDLVALGVLSRVTARGVPVPNEPGGRGLSIVGFDDIPMASMTNPPLTTVAIPVHAVSRAAAATMHSMLDPGVPKAPPLPPAAELATRLLIRGTTGPV